MMQLPEARHKMMQLPEATAAFTRAYRSLLGQVSDADALAFHKHALRTVEGTTGRPAKRACLSDAVATQPHPRFAALRKALEGKHRQELDEVNAMSARAAGSTITTSKAVESRRAGLFLHLPDPIFAHMLRFLSPYATVPRIAESQPHKIDRETRIAHTKDVLNVELVCWDALQSSRRCTEMGMYPNAELVVDGLDAKELFFYKRALESCRSAQTGSGSAQTCFSETDDNVHAWLQALYQQAPAEGSLSCSARPGQIKLPAHSVLMILQAVEPRLCTILHASILISTHELSLPGSLSEKFDHPFDHAKFEHEHPQRLAVIISARDVQLAAALMSPDSSEGGINNCRGLIINCDGIGHCDGLLNQRRVFDEQLLLLSIRKLGHRAGIPRMSGAALRAVLAIMNEKVLAILTNAAVLALHDKKSFQQPPYPEDWQTVMAAAAAHYGQPGAEQSGEGPPLEHQYYPTSACMQEDSGSVFLLGESVVERARELCGYCVYGHQFGISKMLLHEMAGTRDGWLDMEEAEAVSSSDDDHDDYDENDDDAGDGGDENDGTA
jgi:histone H3/H4